MGMIPVSKAHAYGNDFLYVRADTVQQDLAPALAVRLCNRHRGVGADGLILYTLTPGGATMTLLNADGGAAELSGNGLRALAALVVRAREQAGGSIDPTVEVGTSAGPRRLRFEGREGSRYLFVAEMGEPLKMEQRTLLAAGETLRIVVLSIGNPQVVVLGPLPDDERFARLGPAIEKHEAFAHGTNVEFAEVEATDRVRIRIWERGVGPTESSGTGSCAAAVAAAAYGGASRVLDVAAPGGTQRVSWTDRGVELTGWAEILFDGTFLAPI